MTHRVILPLIVAALALIATIGPTITTARPLIDALVIVDITRSMNVRDLGGTSRLDYTRQALRDWIALRPCGSRVGLGVFTERRSLTLFEPVEVCSDFQAISGSIAALDWRMAWEGDSLISKGLNHSLRRAAELGTAVVFVTDGHEAPPLPYIGPDEFRGDSPGGIVIGVGSDTPSPIPKFDDLGRDVGFYEANDLQQAPSRIGAPPTDASERPGYHPRNNPYGESDLEGDEHLSRLNAEYLTDLAGQRGLGFIRLDAGPAAIERALSDHATPRQGTTFFGLAPFIAAASCVLLVALWLSNPRPAYRRRREFS